MTKGKGGSRDVKKQIEEGFKEAVERRSWDLTLRGIEITVAVCALIYAGGQLNEMTAQSKLAQEAIAINTQQLAQNSQQLGLSTEALKNQQRLTIMQMVQGLDKELALNTEKQDLFKLIRKNNKSIFSIFTEDKQIKPEIAVFLDFFVQLAWIKDQPYYSNEKQNIDNDFRVFFKNYLYPFCLNDEVKKYQESESGYKAVCSSWAKM